MKSQSVRDTAGLRVIDTVALFFGDLYWREDSALAGQRIHRLTTQAGFGTIDVEEYAGADDLARIEPSAGPHVFFLPA